MLARTTTRSILFLSSYAPLFLIMGIRSSLESLPIALVFYAITGMSVITLTLFLNTVKQYSSHTVTVVKVESRDSEMTSYIVTYLLPFLVVSFNDPATTVSLAIMLGVIAIVYVQSNLIHINPLLNVLGFHLFEAETEDGKLTSLICKHTYVRTRSTLNVVSLGDYIMMEVQP